jgi:ABC-type nickel/cobalt efflux system permease component RcnA
MGVAWGSLGIVCAVSLAVGVGVVVLVSLALVGLSAREPAVEGARPSAMSPAVGTTIAAVCLLAVVAIIAYGLYVIVA